MSKIVNIMKAKHNPGSVSKLFILAQEECSLKIVLHHCAKELMTTNKEDFMKAFTSLESQLRPSKLQGELLVKEHKLKI